MINSPSASIERERPASARPPTSTPRPPTWGIMNVVLALVMLPFGIGFLLIETLVSAIGRFTNRVSSHTGGLRRAAAR